MLLREELGTRPGRSSSRCTSGCSRPAAGRAAARRPAGLVERDAELAADRRRARAAARPARAACSRSRARPGSARRGCSPCCASGRWTRAPTVLDARAGVLEREFGFGVVRQLFEAVGGEPSRRPPAPRAVFGEGAGRPTACSPSSTRCSTTRPTLAPRRPLVLCIDDLQWSDTASLRFVAYLARRDRRAAGARRRRPSAPASPTPTSCCSAEIGQDPATVAVRPRPLTADGTAGLVARRCSARPTTRSPPPARRSPPATRCCCASCSPRSPPSRSRRTPRTPRRCARSGRARCRGPCCCGSRACRRRPPPWRGRSRSSASSPGCRRSPRSPGSTRREAAETIDALARAEILRADEPLGFVHPLVRDAVYCELPAARRGLEHARAARLLADLGAAPGADRRAADARAAARRRVGGRAAAGGGGDRDRARCARRGARAPAARAGRAAGAASCAPRSRWSSASPRSSCAAPRPPRRSRRPTRRSPIRTRAGMAALMLARTLLFMENPARGDGRRRRRARGAARRRGGPRPRAAGDPDRRRVLRRRRPGQPGRAGGLAGRPAQPGAGREDTDRDHVAGGRGAARRTSHEAAALAGESLEGDEMPMFDRGTFTVLPATVLAMADPAAAEPEWRRSARWRRAAGRCWTRSAPTSGAGSRRSGPVTWCARSRARAGDGGRGAVRQRRQRAHGVLVGVPGARLARARRAERAWEALRPRRSHRAVGRRALLDDQPRRAAAGRRALREVRAIGERAAATRPPETHPLWSPWRGLRARAAAGEGDRRLRRASRAKSWSSLAAAPRRGSWGGLRLLGELTGDAARVA